MCGWGKPGLRAEWLRLQDHLAGDWGATLTVRRVLKGAKNMAEFQPANPAVSVLADAVL
jgi:hypothetical protein